MWNTPKWNLCTSVRVVNTLVRKREGIMWNSVFINAGEKSFKTKITHFTFSSTGKGKLEIVLKTKNILNASYRTNTHLYTRNAFSEEIPNIVNVHLGDFSSYTFRDKIRQKCHLSRWTSSYLWILSINTFWENSKHEYGYGKSVYHNSVSMSGSILKKQDKPNSTENRNSEAGKLTENEICR